MKERLAKTFLDLVKISEVYPEEEKIIEYIESFLDGLKLDHQKDNFGNIIVKVSGQSSPVMINTHMDIPEPNPELKVIREGDIIQSDGSSILGADPKSGLAVILEFLRGVSKRKERRRALEIVFTRGEEAGLKGALNLDYSLLDSKLGLVLDEDGPVTQVVIQAPAFVMMDVEFQGKTAHSRDPDKGINALQVASQAISQVPWGYSHSEVTWNIGFLRAGTARNSIPGIAYLQAELRSYKKDLAQSESERIADIFKEVAGYFGADCQVELDPVFGSYKLERDQPLFRELENTYNKMNLKPNYFATFGGSDANVFNDNGITSVPIGSGYHNAHQYSEYISLSEMVELKTFLDLFCFGDQKFE